VIAIAKTPSLKASVRAVGESRMSGSGTSGSGSLGRSTLPAADPLLMTSDARPLRSQVRASKSPRTQRM
jgi:hypothetical protein